MDLRRRRRCKECHVTFATVEHATIEELKVAKRGGRVETFKRSKLLASIHNAAFVQPITAKEERAIVERVTSDLMDEVNHAPDRPLRTERIGQLVLEHLAASSQVQDGVVIRYAIVLYNKGSSGASLSGSENVLTWLEQRFPPTTSSRSRARKVVKRTGEHENFDLNTLIQSIKIVVDGGRTEEQALELATEIAREAEKRLKNQRLVMSQQIAVELLNILRDTDSIAYLRYASAAKRFRTPEDFYQEALEQHRHEQDATRRRRR